MNEEQIREIVRDEIRREKYKPMGKRERLFALIALPMAVGGIGFLASFHISTVVGVIVALIAGFTLLGLLLKFGDKPTSKIVSSK